MSAIGGIADMMFALRNGRFWPKADMRRPDLYLITQLQIGPSFSVSTGAFRGDFSEKGAAVGRNMRPYCFCYDLVE